MRCELYRHFDKDGNLLYVGISWTAIGRLMNGHRHGAHWFDRITRVEIEHFDSRTKALAAEKLALKNERPAFNVWTDDKRGINCRSDEQKREIADLLGKITAAGHLPRKNSCLSVLRSVWASIEAGDQPDRMHMRALSPIGPVNPPLIPH
jgi:hypothetical protein